MSNVCDIFFNANSWGYKACNYLLGDSTSRCGVNKQGISPTELEAGATVPPTFVGDARVGGESGITINDAGVAIIPAPYLVNIAHDRAQGTDIKIAPIRLTMPNAGSKPIKIIIETVPGTLDPSLAGKDLDGLINVNQVAQSSKAYPIKDASGKVLYYIVDPTKPQNRAPVYVGAYTLEDKTGKINTITQETCSAAAVLGQQVVNDAGVAQNCDSYRIQANGSQNPYEFVVPKEAYAKDNSLDINYGFTLRVDTSNMIPGHKYMLYLKVRLVVGGQVVDGGTIAVDTGVTSDAGVPDAGMPDAGVPDQGTDQ